MVAKTFRELTADAAPALTRLIATQAPSGSSEPTRSTLTQLFAMSSGGGGAAPGWLNVKDYGAVGDGVTNDSAAFQAALNASMAASHGAGEIGGGAAAWTESQPAVFIPPGIYNLATGLTSAAIAQVSFYATPGSVVIEIPAGAYFLTMSNIITSTYIGGIRFVGGKGALRYSYTGTNVKGKHIIEDCYFDAFTECAIGHLASDFPAWIIQRCIFYGTSTSISIALGGFADSGYIMDNEFLNGKYHIKIGDRISGNVEILRNSFLSFNAGWNVANIWFVPNSTDPFGANSGYGTLIEGNKFGSENVSLTLPRILIAKEGTGADRMVKHHSTTASTNIDSDFLSGITISRNRISSVDGMNAPFMYSYIQSIMSFIFVDNIHDGGSYNYCCEFNASAIDAHDGYPDLSSRWIYRTGIAALNVTPFSLGLTNARRFLAEDRSGLLQHYEECEIPGVGDGGYTLLGSAPGNTGLSFTTATAVQATVGENGNAAEVTMTAAGGLAYVSLSPSPVTGRHSYCEITVAAGATLPLTYIQLKAVNFTVGKKAFELIKINLSTTPKTIRIPINWPAHSAQGSWNLTIGEGDYSAGVKTKFRLSNVAIYHAKAPLINSNRMASGLHLNFIRDAAPASSTAPGTKGERFVNNTTGVTYECIATNTWIRLTPSAVATSF